MESIVKNKPSILALSSSRVGESEYLETALAGIKMLLGDAPLKIVFVPFALASKEYDAYGEKVREGLKTLGYSIETISEQNAAQKLMHADCIMIGGGNTFKLLHDLYAFGVVDIIKDKINAGTPYIGWSAGSNLTGPTICTTNDMPIVQPKSFDALNFFPFQINPHYTNVRPPGHHGETRDDRLLEYLLLNPTQKIVALPEGTALLMNEGKTVVQGAHAAVLISLDGKELKKLEIVPGEEIN